MDLKDRHNKFQQILSPDKDDAGVWVHQDAWFHLGKFDKDFKTDYSVKRKGNGVYIFVLKGDVTINEQALNERDGMGIWDADKFSFTSNSKDAEVLLMDVPMTV